MTTFPEALADFTDEELRTLILLRPEAFYPAPPSIASLATRLALPGSAARALHQLSTPAIVLLERLGDAGAEFAPFDATEADLTPLRERALIYGPDNAVRVAPGVLSAMPQGWRVAETAPDDVEELVAGLTPAERRVLVTLSVSGGQGTTKAAAPDADPNTPIATLIAKGLLVRANSTTVRLPRPVRDVLRGYPPRSFPMEEPVTPEVDQSDADKAATTQGLDAVRQLRQLITSFFAGTHPAEQGRFRRRSRADEPEQKARLRSGASHHHR